MSAAVREVPGVVVNSHIVGTTTAVEGDKIGLVNRLVRSCIGNWVGGIVNGDLYDISVSITRCVLRCQCDLEDSGVVESVIRVNSINHLSAAVGKIPGVVYNSHIIGTSTTVECNQIRLINSLVGTSVGYRIRRICQLETQRLPRINIRILFGRIIIGMGHIYGIIPNYPIPRIIIGKMDPLCPEYPVAISSSRKVDGTIMEHINICTDYVGIR